MTKLVRLESDATITESQFTNNLAVALQLGKNASVALKTISVQFKLPPVTISSSNNLIRFATKDYDPNAPAPVGDTYYIPTIRNVIVPRDTYDINEYIQILEVKMNNLVESYTTGSTDEGLEWSCIPVGSSENGYKCDIAYAKMDQKTITAADCSVEIDNVDTMVFTNGVLTKVSADDNLFNSGLVTNIFLNKGSWKMGVTISNQNANPITDSLWYFGFGAEHLQHETDEDILEAELEVGFTRNSGGKYSYKAAGIFKDSGMTIQTNDVLKISKKLFSSSVSYVVYTITRGTESTDFVGDVLEDNDVELVSSGDMYFLLKVGNDTGKIAFQNLTFVPTATLANTNGVYTRVKANQIPDVLKNDALAVQPSKVTVLFPTYDIQSLLGFNRKLIFNYGLSHIFEGTEFMGLNVFNNDMVVELLETPLDGYDHGTKQTRSMLMVISSGDVRGSTVSRGFETFELTFTEPATPIYIGLQNRQTTMTFPQLTLRLTSQGKTLPIEGKISALLLFRDEHDMV